jgi:cyclophilin family peptidyl-prolyl cis-trans isomerase
MLQKLPGLAVLLATAGIILLFALNSSNSSVNPTTPNNSGVNPRVVLVTTLGEVELELLPKEAPNTVANFLKLAGSGFYDGTSFHRVIAGFMIQGGDPNTKTEPENRAIHGTGGPGYVFDDERNQVLLERGVIAMANSGIRVGKGTNGSQFFIVTAPIVDWLNKPGSGWHTPFGRVVRGMEVVQKIDNVPVGENDHPVTDVKVEKVITKTVE